MKKHISVISAAAALLRGGKAAPALSGRIRFYQQTGYVLIDISLSGLPNGYSAFSLQIPGLPGKAGILPSLPSGEPSAALSVLTEHFTLEQILDRRALLAAPSGEPLAHGAIREIHGTLKSIHYLNNNIS